MVKKSISSFRLKADKTGLMIVDVQDRLIQAMDREEWEFTEESIRNLIHLAKIFDMPVFLTEQYPRGLGSTDEAIQKDLKEVKRVERVEKMEFSCWGNQAFRETLKKYDLKSLIVTGMETHICVYQTVLDLMDEEYQIFVPNDSVLSRKGEDLAAGLDLMESAGAKIASSEMLIFQILQKAGTPEFKEMSKRIK